MTIESTETELNFATRPISRTDCVSAVSSSLCSRRSFPVSPLSCISGRCARYRRRSCSSSTSLPSPMFWPGLGYGLPTSYSHRTAHGGSTRMGSRSRRDGAGRDRFGGRRSSVSNGVLVLVDASPFARGDSRCPSCSIALTNGPISGHRVSRNQTSLRLRSGYPSNPDRLNDVEPAWLNLTLRIARVFLVSLARWRGVFRVDLVCGDTLPPRAAPGSLSASRCAGVSPVYRCHGALRTAREGRNPTWRARLTKKPPADPWETW